MAGAGALDPSAAPRRGDRCAQSRPAPAGPAEARYAVGEDGGEVSFDFTFDEPVDIVGGMRLRLWVSAEGSDDMDLYIAVKKLDRDGEIVAVPVRERARARATSRSAGCGYRTGRSTRSGRPTSGRGIRT